MIFFNFGCVGGVVVRSMVERSCEWVSTCACRRQKRASDPLKLELWLWAAWCGSWELNLGLLEERKVLLTTEPSCHPCVSHSFSCSLNFFFSLCIPDWSWTGWAAQRCLQTPNIVFFTSCVLGLLSYPIVSSLYFQLRNSSPVLLFSFPSFSPSLLPSLSSLTGSYVG